MNNPIFVLTWYWVGVYPIAKQKLDNFLFIYFLSWLQVERILKTSKFCTMSQRFFCINCLPRSTEKELQGLNRTF